LVGFSQHPTKNATKGKETMRDTRQGRKNFGGGGGGPGQCANPLKNEKKKSNRRKNQPTREHFYVGGNKHTKTGVGWHWGKVGWPIDVGKKEKTPSDLNAKRETPQYPSLPWA